MPCPLANAEPVGRLSDGWRPTSTAASSSMVSNRPRRGARDSETLFDLRRQFTDCVRAPGLGLCGRRRMSGIKKNSKLGFTARSDPPTSDDRRGGISLSAASLTLSPSPSLFTLHSALLRTTVGAVQCCAVLGLGLGLELGLDLGPGPLNLDLGLLVKRQASEICEVGAALLAPCHPSTRLRAHRFNGTTVRYMCCVLAGIVNNEAILAACWFRGGVPGGSPWVPGAHKDIDCSRVGDDQDGEADPLDPKLSGSRYRAPEDSDPERLT
jgi:hypothetical protein